MVKKAQWTIDTFTDWYLKTRLLQNEIDQVDLRSSMVGKIFYREPSVGVKRLTNDADVRSSFKDRASYSGDSPSYPS